MCGLWSVERCPGRMLVRKAVHTYIHRKLWVSDSVSEDHGYVCVYVCACVCVSRDVHTYIHKLWVRANVSEDHGYVCVCVCVCACVCVSRTELYIHTHTHISMVHPYTKLVQKAVHTQCVLEDQGCVCVCVCSCMCMYVCACILPSPDPGS
jgi:hypothetical protein